MPQQRARSTPALGQQQRLAWLRRVLTEPLEATLYRIAAALLLLYAQPFTRIAALRIDDVTDTPTGMTIRLGGDPAPVPAPFAALVRQHLACPPNLRHTG